MRANIIQCLIIMLIREALIIIWDQNYTCKNNYHYRSK